MSKAKHTPGKWTVVETTHGVDRGCINVSGVDPKLGSVRLVSVLRPGFGSHNEMPQETRRANARLIAAAPEMLVFAEKHAASINCMCKGPIAQVAALVDWPNPCEKCQLEALIAKAKGD